MNLGELFQGNPDLAKSYPVVRDYFNAWRSVCQHTADGIEPWDDGVNRWDLIRSGKGKGKSPFITMEMPFESVLSLFPLAHELATDRAGGASPTEEHFIEVLRPLAPLDWADFDMLNKAWPQKKQAPSDLYTFFSWAIEDYAANGELHDPEEVWNPKNRDPSLSKPGRGFFSPPNPDSIRIFSSVMPGEAWPKTGDITVWTPLIPNARRIVEWQIRVDGKPRPSIRKVVQSDGSSLVISQDREIATATEVSIACFWTNWNGSASKEIVLTRGDAGLAESPETGDLSVQAEEMEPQPDEGDEEEAQEFVLVLDHGDGPIRTPPAPNQPRRASTAVFAPARMRAPWCSRCFHGSECKLNWCAVRDKGTPRS